MNYSSFTSQEKAYQHSKEHVLDYLYQYDDFMESIGRVVDLGCDPEALNMLWFANATTNDSLQTPLNIKCVGQSDINQLVPKHKGISFQKGVPETLSKTSKKFDVLFCYDTLQWIINPYQALSNWWNIANKDSMLVIAVPQTTNVEFNMLEYNANLNHKHHYTIPMLMYQLAVNGWDCNGGFFKKAIGDPWIFAVVYRSDIEPMDPNTTNLFTLVQETNLLPKTAADSIQKYGMIRQRDLLLTWLDSNNMDMRQQ